MTDIKLPQTRLMVTRRMYKDSAEINFQIQESEVPMNQQQSDAYKSIIGDANASVTVSRELSESNYGSGGRAFVSVTLKCDQSQQGIGMAVDLAKNVADYFIQQHFSELQNRCQQMGLLVPRNSP